jgi:hypothetical protein
MMDLNDNKTIVVVSGISPCLHWCGLLVIALGFNPGQSYTDRT